MGMHQEEWIHPKILTNLYNLYMLQRFTRSTQPILTMQHFIFVFFVSYYLVVRNGGNNYVPAWNRSGWIYIH
jgi:hypothetical protein